MKTFFLISVVLTNILFAQTIYIASPSCVVNSLSKYQLKQFYLGHLHQHNDKKVIALNIEDSTLQKEFTTTILNKTPNQLKMYWSRMLFTGRKTPLDTIKYEDLSKLEQSKECHITYVQEGKVAQNWSIIEISE